MTHQVAALSFNTTEDGPVFSVTYDSESSKLKFNALMPADHALELRFSPNKVDKADQMTFISSFEGRAEDSFGNFDLSEIDEQQDLTNLRVDIS